MEHHDHASTPHLPGLGVYAAEIEVHPFSPASEQTCRRLICTFVERLAASAVADGATVIGHIKAVLQSHDGGYLYAGATSGHESVRCQGELAGQHADLKLAVNALVFGVEGDRLRLAVYVTAIGLAYEFGFRFEISDSTEAQSHPDVQGPP